jgi:hypothetical protein
MLLDNVPPTTCAVDAAALVLFSTTQTQQMITSRSGQLRILRSPTARQEYDHMVHDLLFAILFLAMIAAPVYVNAFSERNKRDSR